MSNHCNSPVLHLLTPKHCAQETFADFGFVEGFGIEGTTVPGSALGLTSSPSRISGGEQWRCGGRRAAMLGRLFVSVANFDQ